MLLFIRILYDNGILLSLWLMQRWRRVSAWGSSPGSFQFHDLVWDHHLHHSLGKKIEILPFSQFIYHPHFSNSFPFQRKPSRSYMLHTYASHVLACICIQLMFLYMNQGSFPLLLLTLPFPLIRLAYAGFLVNLCFSISSTKTVKKYTCVLSPRLK